MKKPSPLEYITEHGVLVCISSVLVGFAVIGIFAAIEEIAFRLKRYRYRKSRDERRGKSGRKIRR